MRRGETVAWGCAVLGFLGAGVAFLVDPDGFARGWLAAVDGWMLWPLGSLALVKAHALTGGRWGDAAAPGLRLGVRAMPLLILALLPVVLLMPHLYHWASPAEAGHVKNAWWLNPQFFQIRMAVYLVIWLGLSLLGRRMAALSLILLALTFTGASIDLTLSLEDFNSNIWGMLRASSAGLVALSVATLVAAPFASRDALADLAKLLLALVVLWTYLDFMQLLIVWQSNLATDSGWYVHRTTQFWGSIAIVITLFRFAVPFLLLVNPAWQRSPAVVGIACWLFLVMTALRSWWIVLPAFGHGIGFADIACTLGWGGLTAGLISRIMPRPVSHPAFSHV